MKSNPRDYYLRRAAECEGSAKEATLASVKQTLLRSAKAMEKVG